MTPLWWQILAAVAVPRRALRMRRTVYDAAQATGVAESYITRLCRGRP